MTSNSIANLVGEAADLRRQVSSGTVSDTLTTLHERLVRTRALMDRIEEIVAHLLRMQYAARAKAADAQASLDDKWDEVARRPVMGFSVGDPAPRERYARYNAETLNERVAVRKAERDARMVEGALEVCRWYHQGMRDTRYTLDTRIRLVTMESRLER